MTLGGFWAAKAEGARSNVSRVAMKILIALKHTPTSKCSQNCGYFAGASAAQIWRMVSS